MESNRRPGQGGTGTSEGFIRSYVTREPLARFGQRRGCCGLHVNRVSPAVRLRLQGGTNRYGIQSSRYYRHSLGQLSPAPTKAWKHS